LGQQPLASLTFSFSALAAATESEDFVAGLALSAGVAKEGLVNDDFGNDFVEFVVFAVDDLLDDRLSSFSKSSSALSTSNLSHDS
jgi:hypothetical protein